MRTIVWTMDVNILNQQTVNKRRFVVLIHNYYIINTTQDNSRECEKQTTHAHSSKLIPFSVSSVIPTRGGAFPRLQGAISILD